MNEITITIPVLGQVDSGTGKVLFAASVLRAAEVGRNTPPTFSGKIELGIDRVLRKDGPLNGKR